MKKLIINADDFGLTKGTNEGIIKAIREGVVTSTTVMINMPYAYEGLKKLRERGFESVGVHLTLTCGKPTLPTKEVSTLVDENNNFYKRRDNLFPKMSLEEVERELRNQIDLFLETGLRPSHLDSHHHIHMYDGVREVVVKLAKEYSLPLRCPNKETKGYLEENNVLTTDDFSMEFYGEGVGISTIKKIIGNSCGNTIEIMAHPAIVSEELRSLSSYSNNRSKELKILVSEELKSWLAENHIKLISFNDI